MLRTYKWTRKTMHRKLVIFINCLDRDLDKVVLRVYNLYERRGIPRDESLWISIKIFFPSTKRIMKLRGARLLRFLGIPYLSSFYITTLLHLSLLTATIVMTNTTLETYKIQIYIVKKCFD